MEENHQEIDNEMILFWKFNPAPSFEGAGLR
jgi:hypothetical protein